LFIAGIVLDVAFLILLPLEIMFPISESEAESLSTSDALGILVGLLYLGVGVLGIIVYAATIVFFLMWLYRAYQNLPAFGVPKSSIEYSSGWAVGSFFIPFVSLIVPYRAVRELWRKSLPNSQALFGQSSPPVFFPIWWAFWLISSLLNQIYFRMMLRGNFESDPPPVLDVVIGFFDIGAAILAIMVVKEIVKQQTESSKLIPQFSEPPPPMAFEQQTPSSAQVNNPSESFRGFDA
jgi:hypothetical protein